MRKRSRSRNGEKLKQKQETEGEKEEDKSRHIKEVKFGEDEGEAQSLNQCMLGVLLSA